MLTCLFPCLYVPYILCHLPCACALHAMFVCLGLDLVCHAMCYCSSFVPFTLLSCVFGLTVRTRSRPYGLCHRPYAEAHIKGFGSPYFHVYACLLLCFMLVLASLVIGCATFNALSGFVVVWLHSTSLRSCLNVTLVGCLTPSPHVTKLPYLRIKICCHPH